MPTTITNQASLNFQYNGQNASAVSNIATATLTAPLSTAKNSIERVYRAGQELTFIISFVNSGASVLNDVTVLDNLGTYNLTEDIAVTPLTFMDPALLYINGSYIGPLTATQTASSVSFPLASLAAGANAQIIYKAVVNQTAPLALNSEIQNTVTISASGLNTPVTATNTVRVEAYADIEILKGMSPANIVDGSAVTYTFTITNSGNTEATNIVLTDTFSPAPSSTGLQVMVDGTPIAQGNYTYVNGVLTLPAGPGYTIALEPAEITQSPTTGIVTTVPSSTTITVTGIL